LRATGGATGGAQFSATTGSSSIGGNSVMSQPGFYNDYRQVDTYVQFGSKGLQMMRKSDSDKGPITNGSSKSSTNSPNTPKRSGSGKKHRRKFKRSLTMTSLPLAFFKGCTSGNQDPNSPDSPILTNGNGNVIGRSISTGNDPLKNGITNNNTVKNATKFTIGTSDESDEDDNAENTQDLEHLFCPLTDSQGSPIVDDGDDSLATSISLCTTIGAGDRTCVSDIELPPPPAMLGEQMSASSCRRVHSEILESVSKIKCSLLGRKGGYFTRMEIMGVTLH